MAAGQERSLLHTLKNILLEPLRVLRNLFFSGAIVVIPLGITVWLVLLVGSYFDGMPAYINRRFDIEFLSWIPGYVLGIIITVTIVSLVGFTTQLYLGRKLLQLLEYILHKIPVISPIYRGVKQVSDQLVGRRKRLFERVALLEYPRKGLFALVFITGKDSFFNPLVKKNLIYVFLPTTPNPTSGFFLIVPEEELIITDINVEEAMKLVISSGMVSPTGKPAEISAEDIPKIASTEFPAGVEKL